MPTPTVPASASTAKFVAAFILGVFLGAGGMWLAVRPVADVPSGTGVASQAGTTNAPAADASGAALFGISGTVISVSGDTLKLDAGQFAKGGTGQGMRTITVPSDVSITMVSVSDVPVAKGDAQSAPETKVLKLSELVVGQSLTVYAETDVTEVESFTAVRITADPVVAKVTPAMVAPPLPPPPTDANVIPDAGGSAQTNTPPPPPPPTGVQPPQPSTSTTPSTPTKK